MKTLIIIIVCKSCCNYVRASAGWPAYTPRVAVASSVKKIMIWFIIIKRRNYHLFYVPLFTLKILLFILIVLYGYITSVVHIYVYMYIFELVNKQTSVISILRLQFCISKSSVFTKHFRIINTHLHVWSALWKHKMQNRFTLKIDIAQLTKLQLILNYLYYEMYIIVKCLREQQAVCH